MKTSLPFIDAKPDLNNVIQKISAVLSNISKDNMKCLTLEGKCSIIGVGSYYTTTLYHNSGQVPAFVFIYDGDVSIPKYGVTKDSVIVNSLNQDELFTIILVM